MVGGARGHEWGNEPTCAGRWASRFPTIVFRSRECSRACSSVRSLDSASDGGQPGRAHPKSTPTSRPRILASTSSLRTSNRTKLLRGRADSTSPMQRMTRVEAPRIDSTRHRRPSPLRSPWKSRPESILPHRDETSLCNRFQPGGDCAFVGGAWPTFVATASPSDRGPIRARATPTSRPRFGRRSKPPTAAPISHREWRTSFSNCDRAPPLRCARETRLQRMRFAPTAHRSHDAWRICSCRCARTRPRLGSSFRFVSKSSPPPTPEPSLHLDITGLFHPRKRRATFRSWTSFCARCLAQARGSKGAAPRGGPSSEGCCAPREEEPSS